MRRLLPLLLALTPGCQALLSGDDPAAECQSADDCPVGEGCDLVEGRCFLRPDAAPDMAPLDAAVEALDGAPDVAPDARPPAEDAGGDAGAPDGAAAAQPFGPQGDCFGDLRNPLATMPDGSAHVPFAVCAPEVFVWTEVVDGAPRLHARQTYDEDDAILGPRAPGAIAETVVDGVVAFEDDGEPSRIMAWDAVNDAVEPVSDTGRAQSAPSQAPGIIAWVEAADEGSRIVVKTDEGLRDCGVADRAQWGVATGADWIAWFERRPVSRRVSLVVTRGFDCKNERLTLSLSGSVRPDARLTGAGSDLFWIQADVAGVRAVWRINRLRLADPPAPVAALAVSNPVSVVARGHWLVVEGYRPGGNRLALLDLRTGTDVAAIGAAGNGRRPNLTARFVTWAQQVGAQPWEIRYESLAD